MSGMTEEGIDSHGDDCGTRILRANSTPLARMLVAPARPRMGSSGLPSILIPDSGFRSGSRHNNEKQPALAEFSSRIEKQFQSPLQTEHLRSVSSKLQAQFREKLERSDICMLPSYKDSLPNGSERGTSLVLDVGGSGLRVAQVRLNGRSRGRKHATQLVKRSDFAIDERIRALEGKQFFAWMARRIRDALRDGDEVRVDDRHRDRLPVGLTWSFPVDQKSKRDAGLLRMGKDFRASQGLIGQNLADLVEEACLAEGISVAVHAVVNDSAASLLSEIYVEGSTSMAVILGTGLNAAIHLPATAMSPHKLGLPSLDDPMSSVPPSPNVLVNTELSMFGKDVLTTTPWDDFLNLEHSQPDFQPLEHLTSGRYLGEIVRLIVVKAIQTANLFDGETPRNLGPYQLQTSTLAVIEGDTTAFVFKGGSVFSALHPLPSLRSYTREELTTVREFTIHVSNRAAAYMATAIHALWSLKRDAEAADSSPNSPAIAPADATTPDSSTAAAEPACISCLGSVLGKYPHFRERVQNWLDLLTAESCDEILLGSANSSRRIRLEMTSEDEGALIGAAVAVALGVGADERFAGTDDDGAAMAP